MSMREFMMLRIDGMDGAILRVRKTDNSAEQVVAKGGCYDQRRWLVFCTYDLE